MHPTKIIKIVVSTVVGAGTTKIVNDIISSNVDTENVKDKVTVSTASFVVGAMVAERTKSWTDHQIDEITNLVQKLRGKPTFIEE